MDILIIKLALTPLLIAALTLIGRRWGSATGGALAGLPLTSGPVSLFLALEQGRNFAAQAAVGTLAGLIGVAAFCFAYSLTATQMKWIGSTAAGLAAFFAAAILLIFAPPILLPTFAIVVALLALIFFNMPSAANRSLADGEAIAFPHPKWDLPLRMAVATALVSLLTALVHKLGSQVAGLLSTFPVFGLVLTVFAHRRFGAEDAQRVLRGVVLGSFAFAVFFLIVGGTLGRYGCAATYWTATIGALTVNALLFAQLRRNL